MSTNSESLPQNKISSIVLAVIYITLILSVVAIVVAIGAYTQGESFETWAALLGVGFIAMALAGYILLQSRKRVSSLKIETPPILTAIECKQCNEKATREFKRGDFVFKEDEKCPKCSTPGMIVAIYREVKEKEKPAKI